MSRCIDVNTVSDQQLDTMSKDLNIELPPPKFSRAPPKLISVFAMDQNLAFLPFYYARSHPRPARESFPSISPKFIGTLRPHQEEVKKEAIQALNKYGAVTIAAYPSFGKTSLAIHISTLIKLPVLILCHRIVLIDQWKKSIEKFCPEARVQILSGNDKMEPCDFYIMNAANVPKKSRSFYSTIGFLIVDESHLIMAESLSRSMTYILPRYVLGLSATPYRYDGLNILFDLYFGPEKIERKLFRKHTVYKVETGFKPQVEITRTGRMDWGNLIQQQSEYMPRNELIIRIVKHFSDRVFLILCKRISQAKYLIQRLNEEKELVTSLVGTEQEYDPSARILVGTSSKCSVGFDHPRLNTLLLAVDLEQYFIQVLGRVFRTPEVEPVIFDLVDTNSVLTKHFKSRCATYIEHGGDIKIFHNIFPMFPMINE